MPLLDLDYQILSDREKIDYLRAILAGFSESALMSDEYNDVKSVFEDYRWKPKAHVDQVRFLDLKNRGIAGTITDAELDEFMALVSDAGEYHLYFLLCKTKTVLQLAPYPEEFG